MIYMCLLGSIVLSYRSTFSLFLLAKSSTFIILYTKRCQRLLPSKREVFVEVWSCDSASIVWVIATGGARGHSNVVTFFVIGPWCSSSRDGEGWPPSSLLFISSFLHFPIWGHRSLRRSSVSSRPSPFEWPKVGSCV